MTAPLSPQEAAIVARFDAAPDAPESLRERVARAIASVDLGLDVADMDDDAWAYYVDEILQREFLEMADAAVAVMRGES